MMMKGFEMFLLFAAAIVALLVVIEELKNPVEIFVQDLNILAAN